jgi:hypothetical protein
MSGQRNDGGESQSTSAPNELREFFKGPMHVLIFKVPLLLIGAIIYMAYYIIKTIFVKLIRVIYSSVLSIPRLFENINFYLTLLYDRILKWTGYFVVKQYKNIIKPVRIFVRDHILPTVYNEIQRIAQKIGWLGVVCYQSIVQSTARLCYAYLIVQFPEWIDYVSVTLHNNLCLLYRTVKFTCLWMWANILHPLCLWIYSDILLRSYRTVIRMLSFIYIEFLPTTDRFARRTAQIVWYWLNRFILYIYLDLLRAIWFIYDSSSIVYRRVLLPLYQTVVRFILHINNKILKPVIQRITPIVKIISYYLMKVVFHAIIYVSHAIIYSYHSFIPFCRHNLLSFYQTLIRMCTFIYTVGPRVTYRLARRTVQIILYCLDCFIFYIDRSLVRAIHFIYDVGQWALCKMKIISYNLMKIVFYIFIYSSYAIINSYNAFVLICRQYLLPNWHILIQIYSFIHHQILPVVGRFTMRILRTIWCWLKRFILCVRLGLLNMIRFIYNASRIVYGYVLLPYYRAVIRFCLYVNNEMLKPVGQRIISLVKTIYYCLMNVICNATTSVLHTIIYSYDVVVFIYREYLIPLWHTLIIMYSFIYAEILRPVKRLIIIMRRIICFRFYELVFYPMILSLYEISEICYNSIIKPFGNVLSTMPSAILNISHTIMITVCDGINAIRLAIVALCNAVMNWFYYFTES